MKTRTPAANIDSQIIPSGPAPEEATKKIVDIAHYMYLIDLKPPFSFNFWRIIGTF